MNECIINSVMMKFDIPKNSKEIKQHMDLLYGVSCTVDCVCSTILVLLVFNSDDNLSF
jgi:hypothetical protein